MHSYQNVDRFLREQNSDERALIKHIEEQEKLAAGQKPEETKTTTDGGEEKKEQGGKKWKQKFIKIWQYNEMLEQTGQKPGEENEQVGPKNFMPIMKLGQGSFGQVFLVDKITIKQDGT